MTNKAVFLDRDGTINVEKNYLYRIEEFELLPNVIEGLRLLQIAGYKLVIITNQSGIARGYYSEEDLHKLNAWMVSMMKEKGVYISDVYYCPHLADASVEKYRIACNCRKPKIGMFEKAISDHTLDIKQCVAIGDRLRDCCICEMYNCRGYLIGNTEEAKIIDQIIEGEFKNIEYAESLYAAAQRIIKMQL